MKKNLILTSIATGLLSLLPVFANASIETFDTKATAEANGFLLGPNIGYVTPGRPFLDSQQTINHTITWVGGGNDAFTFTSLWLNAYPADNYWIAEKDTLSVSLLGIGGDILLSTIFQFPQDPVYGIVSQSWQVFTPASPVAGVHQIVLSKGPMDDSIGYWPSFDNLNYSDAGSSGGTGGGQPVYEPGDLMLMLAGGLAWAVSKTGFKSNRKSAVACAGS